MDDKGEVFPFIWCRPSPVGVKWKLISLGLTNNDLFETLLFYQKTKGNASVSSGFVHNSNGPSRCRTRRIGTGFSPPSFFAFEETQYNTRLGHIGARSVPQWCIGARPVLQTPIGLDKSA